MAQTTDDIIVFLLMLLSILFEEIKALVTPNNKVILIKKSKSELKKMLKGELIDLVISYQQ